MQDTLSPSEIGSILQIVFVGIGTIAVFFVPLREATKRRSCRSVAFAALMAPLSAVLATIAMWIVGIGWWHNLRSGGDFEAALWWRLASCGGWLGIFTVLTAAGMRVTRLTTNAWRKAAFRLLGMFGIAAISTAVIFWMKLDNGLLEYKKAPSDAPWLLGAVNTIDYIDATSGQLLRMTVGVDSRQTLIDTSFPYVGSAQVSVGTQIGQAGPEYVAHWSLWSTRRESDWFSWSYPCDGGLAMASEGVGYDRTVVDGCAPADVGSVRSRLWGGIAGQRCDSSMRLGTDLPFMPRSAIYRLWKASVIVELTDECIIMQIGLEDPTIVAISPIRREYVVLACGWAPIVSRVHRPVQKLHP